MLKILIFDTEDFFFKKTRRKKEIRRIEFFKLRKVSTSSWDRSPFVLLEYPLWHNFFDLYKFHGAM